MDCVQTNELTGAEARWHNEKLHLTFRSAPWGGVSLMMTREEASKLALAIATALEEVKP